MRRCGIALVSLVGHELSAVEGPKMQAIPALVTAGDRRAAKPVCGESKVFLELAGRALVVHTVLELQWVAEISEVWLVGDAERLEAVFGHPDVRAKLVKPLHIVGQFRDLYENSWETFRRLLPGAGESGRDPDGSQDDIPVLYLSADIPFATAQEISLFVRRGLEIDCDFAFGLVTEESMQAFCAVAPAPRIVSRVGSDSDASDLSGATAANGKPGIQMAYFNLLEGRFRTSNLHLVKPARIANRAYIEEMFEHRYQRQFGNIVGLALRLVRKEEGGLPILYYYVLIHLAGLADRWDWRRLADRIRSWVPVKRIEDAVSGLLRADFRFVVTDVGGCALDIDNRADFEAATHRFDEWKSQQRERASKMYGALPLTQRVEPSPMTERSQKVKR